MLLPKGIILLRWMKQRLKLYEIVLIIILIKWQCHGNKLEINGHELMAVRCAHGVLWVTFEELCKKPRHVKDYLAVSKQFHTILIADLPILQSRDNNAVKRFIHAHRLYFTMKRCESLYRQRLTLTICTKGSYALRNLNEQRVVYMRCRPGITLRRPLLGKYSS